MPKPIIINRTIKKYNKKIKVDGDKSLSIRFALLASQAIGRSKAYNLLKSEDVVSTINCLKKLGVKIKWDKKNNFCLINGNGLNSYVYKNNLTLNGNNSGTCVRLLTSLLINSSKKIKIVGDKSLSKRDMKRIIDPLTEFGATFYPKNKNTLPLYIKGSNYLTPINYLELKGSSQCKSSVMLAALLAPGETRLMCKPSRNHTELLFKYLKIPIKIKKIKNFEIIKIKGRQNFNAFNYNVPSDISSSAFFIVLTLLSKGSKLILEKVGVNKSRTGVIEILNKMGAKINLKNKKNYKGEIVADIHVRSAQSLKSINCPTKLNTSAIDEFLIIFLAAAKAKGISYFKNLEELNKKESRRLDWGSKILSMMGVKNKLIKNHGIKIWGQPNLKLNKKYEIKNYLKDHRVMAMSTIAALTLGGEWKIHEPESIKTSFPSFFKILKKDLGSKINL
ncbi:MAG: 3-phosphoshikimate 1-carboxyvinyltransferase [Pelagibacterales bacterium]|nr:3-phosphoshikimate 1-carboxyvinyltransferase [Pelagibacterales bacterium]